MHIVPRRRAVALLAGAGAALCAACSGGGSSPPPAGAASTAGPSASVPPATPAVPTPPRVTGSVPTEVAEGTPPVTYSVPAGFSVALATDQLVQLASTRGAELLSFALDPSIEDVSHALGMQPLDGETGYVLRKGATADGLYSEVVVVRHHGTQYEVSCTGYRGYDAALLTTGCGVFLDSLRWR